MWRIIILLTQRVVELKTSLRPSLSIYAEEACRPQLRKEGILNSHFHVKDMVSHKPCFTDKGVMRK